LHLINNFKSITWPNPICKGEIETDKEYLAQNFWKKKKSVKSLNSKKQNTKESSKIPKLPIKEGNYFCDKKTG